MSSKPTVGQIPTWDSGLVNTIALTGGHKTNGYANNEIPTSGEMNTWMNTVGLWGQYLSDGNLQGAVTMDTSLVMAANTSTTVSGTGLYKRGTRVRHYPASAGSYEFAAPTYPLAVYGNRGLGSTGQILRIPLTLDEGEQVSAIVAYVQCSAVGSINMKFLKTVDTVGLARGNEAQIGTTQISTGSTSVIEALTLTGLSDLTTNTVGSRISVSFTALDANLPLITGLYVTTTVP